MLKNRDSMAEQSYALDPLRISLSPASKTAIVEHLKSFPHAVPNSIYTCCVSIRIPSKVLVEDFFAGSSLDIL